MELRVLDPADESGLVRVEAAGVSGWCVWPDAPGVDEQDVATLRLPGGAILLVDTVGEPPLDVVGGAVILHLDHVVVRPTQV